MRSALLLASLLMCQMTFAQSMKEKKTKQEMLDRVDLLIGKIELTREDLEKEDVVAACKTVKEIFSIYPDHLKGIGSHMDMSRSKTIKAKDDALRELIFIHKKSLLCDRGNDSEYVNPELLRKEMKVILNSLKKQKKVIEKSDTSFENAFYYQYEF